MLTLPNLSTHYGRWLFRKKVQEGWEPTPGTYWAVMSVDPERPSRKAHLPVVRADSMQVALGLSVEQANPESVIGPIFVCGKQEVTAADVLTWRDFRDRHAP